MLIILLMGVEQKQNYRRFLKSEHWRSVKASAMVKADSKCYICNRESFSNEGHHFYYPSRWSKTSTDHIVILCRSCHHGVTRAMAEIPPFDSVKEARDWFYRYANTRRDQRFEQRLFSELMANVRSALPIYYILLAMYEKRSKEREATSGPALLRIRENDKQCRLCFKVSESVEWYNFFHKLNEHHIEKPHHFSLMCPACSALLHRVRPSPAQAKNEAAVFREFQSSVVLLRTRLPLDKAL